MQSARCAHSAKMKVGQTRIGWTGINRICAGTLLVLISFCETSIVFAGSIKVACEGESVTIPGWTSGTMNVIYDDSEKGKIAIKGPHTDFSLPATLISMASADPPSNIISASGQTQAVMPDLAAVDSCVASKVSPDQKNDRDVYLITALSCIEGAPPSAGPVPIIASVKLGLMKGEATEPPDTWLEGEITYTDKSAGPDGKLTIPLFPKECKVVPYLLIPGFDGAIFSGEWRDALWTGSARERHHDRGDPSSDTT